MDGKLGIFFLIFCSIFLFLDKSDGFKTESFEFIRRDNGDEGHIIRSDDTASRIRLISLRKETVGDAVTLSVVYWTNVDDAVYRTWYKQVDASVAPIEEQEIDTSMLSGGVTKTVIKVPIMNEKIFLNIAAPMESVFVVFNKNGPDSDYVEDFPWPVVIVPEEIVYTPGAVTEFETSFQLDEQTNPRDPIYSRSSTDNKLVDLETGKFVPEEGPKNKLRGFLYVIERRTENNLDTSIIGINSSLALFSGFMSSVMMAKIPGNNEIITDIFRLKRLAIRPSTQTGVFPEGFIEFGSAIQVDDDKTALVYCEVNETCTFSCDVYGTNLSDLRLYKQINRNEWQNMAFYKQFSFKEKNFLYGVAITIAPIWKPTEVYKCEASNADGVIRAQKKKILFYQDVEILQNESFVGEIDSNSIQVICVVVSYVEPVFELTLAYNDNFYISEDVQVSNSGNKYTAVGNFHIDPYYNWYGGTGSTNSTTCKAGVYQIWNGDDSYTINF